MLVAPSKTRKPFLSVLDILLPIIAAWLEPRPGRKPQSGEAIKEAIKGLKKPVFSFVISCFGIWVLFLIVRIKADAPKRPVKRGSND